MSPHTDAPWLHRVLTLVLGQGHAAPQPERALALLAERPGFRPPLVRWLLGDMAGALEGHASLSAPSFDPNAPLSPCPGSPWCLPPLALVAFSSLARVGHEAALVAALQRLLSLGADPRAVWRDPQWPDRPLPLLYGAVTRARSAAMVQVLLEAGADANDGESLYHAVEQVDRRLVALLVAAGARWACSNALFRQLDAESIEQLQQVLDLGADANELSAGTGTRPLHHAVLRGRSLPHLRLLLQHGADLAATDGHGHSLAWHAARAGRRDVLAWLAALGHEPPADPVQRFLAACAAADEPLAQAMLRAQPGLLASLAPWDLALLPEQAQRGGLSSVRLMLTLGWPVAVPGPWQASALNQAAFRGDAAMVALLLQHGARWHERNGYGGDALGSCLHAGCHEPVAGGDYAEVLRLLLADGAPPPSDDGSLPEPLRAVLTERRRP